MTSSRKGVQTYEPSFHVLSAHSFVFLFSGTQQKHMHIFVSGTGDVLLYSCSGARFSSAISTENKVNIEAERTRYSRLFKYSSDLPFLLVTA